MARLAYPDLHLIASEMRQGSFVGTKMAAIRSFDQSDGGETCLNRISTLDSGTALREWTYL